MNTAAADDDRLAFAPPKQPGLLRGFALAVLAHGLLVAGLMHGLQWKRDAQDAAVEAELWSALPQQAAPREVPPPPPPPEPVVKAPPAPVVKAPPEPDPQVQRDAQIALEREKQKRERELEKRELEKRKLVEQRAKLEAQKKKQREEELARKKLEQQKLVAEAKRKEEEKRRKQEEQEAREAKKLAAIREENMKRMQGMAGTGAPSSTGAAAQSSGPSASWAGRVQARVRPNIVFTDAVSGNPKAEVEVRAAPDGTIVSKRLVKSSGVKSWDEAVLRALDKTEVLPRDVDGRVPSPVTIEFRPRS
jgi:colicin import membrane protein